MPKNTPVRIIDSRQPRAISFLGGSGSTGGVTDHGMLSGLLDDDHAQYLLADGTRTLTGNMAVAASVTIDGVDISAHAANANAHHAQQHAITGSDHTVTGSAYQIVGLTSTNTLGLLTAASSPTANQVVKTDGSSAVTLVDLTVSSDLFMTGTLDFGTDTMYEDASYLQVTGSKAVRFGQNIGNANWTVYNAGGAAFGGSVDITNGGDLTVGSNVLFVDNSLAGVGINMAPDPQFALDINGPARATYWIGPHAIQLKNVLLLSHFDGRLPYETNNSGEPNGHMGQVATVTGGTIYRPGKYYKALQCGPAITNLITNPSFETGTTGWGTDYAGTTTIANIAGGVYGSNQMVVYSTTQPSNVYSPAASVSNSTSYAVSFWYKLNTAGTVIIQQFTNSSVRSSETLPAATEWTRYTKIVTTTSTAATMRIYVTMPASGRLDIDAVQIEQSNVISPYCDGSLGDGHTWSGTAHASTSSRTAATLRYGVTGNINAEKGTVMLWVYADQWNPNTGNIWQAGNAAAEFDAFVDSSGQYIQRANGTNLTASGTLAVKTWHHLAFTWDTNSNTRTVYVNGAAAGSTTLGGMPTLDTGIAVGYNNHLGSIYGHIGYVDDFCILDRVMPASEIRSVYESNAPVFAETSTFSFRPTPKGLIWADDEGLWMRDTAGSPVLGAYGGEAATKSWAGFTMAAGDLVLGSNAVGSSAIWWDKSAGTFGFYGAGSATAQVVVNTSGQITFGGGHSAIDASGLALDSKTSWAYTDVGTSVSWYTDPIARTGYAGSITAGDWAAGGTEAGILFHVSNAFPSDRLLQVKWGTGTNYDVWHGGNIGITSWGGSEYIFDKTVEAVQVRANSDSAGKASTVTITNGTQGVSSGAGSVKLNGTTARDSTGWLKIYVGTAIRYIPYWTTVTG